MGMVKDHAATGTILFYFLIIYTQDENVLRSSRDLNLKKRTNEGTKRSANFAPHRQSRGRRDYPINLPLFRYCTYIPVVYHESDSSAVKTR